MWIWTFDTGYVNAALGYRFRTISASKDNFLMALNEIGEAGLPGIPSLRQITQQRHHTCGTFPTLERHFTPLGHGPKWTIFRIHKFGVVLNPGPPLTNASAINVGPFTVPAGTNLSVIPGFNNGR